MAAQWTENGRGPEDAVLVELPDGAYPARLDDRGRIKMPVEFQRYLANLREKKLFVTTFDKRTVRIYPIEVWRYNRSLLTTATENREAAEDLLFLAYHWGATTEMDNQGRILIHEELRRGLRLENQPVRLVPWRWRIDVYAEAGYEERVRKADEGAPDKLRTMEDAGLR